MTDYAAAPIQPLVQGLVTFPGGVGTTPVFTGRGVSAITRDPAAGGFGGYILQLDPGLPGLAGALDPGTPLLPEPDARTTIITRGFGSPPFTPITGIAVSYLLSPVPGVGADRVEVVLTNVANTPTDPPGGFEIIIWRGF